MKRERVRMRIAVTIWRLDKPSCDPRSEIRILSRITHEAHAVPAVNAQYVRISEIAKKRSATQSWSQTYTSLLEWSSQLADISWWEHNLPNDSLSATHPDDKNFLSISASFSFGLFTSIESNYTLSLLWIPDGGLKTRAQSCRNFQEV